MAKSRNRKKKKKQVRQSRLTGAKLIASIIKSKARSFELYKCYSIKNWNDFRKINTITVVKKYGQDKYCMGVFLVDAACLGLKNTNYIYNLDLDEVEETLGDFYNQEDGYKEIEYDLVNELVWGSIEYAKELGFKPNKDFKLSQYFLCAERDLTDNYELEFGVDGKPFYIAGPYDNAELIMGKLTNKLGPDGFNYLLPFNAEMDGMFSSLLDDDDDDDFAEDIEVEYLD